jgi:hypothetical protein
MAETTLLRTSAIVRNATFAPPQHGPVKTGALPLVQVRMTPGGPQIQNKQKEVEILPPRDAKSALAIGGLPMVQVKMTQNGPQADDGRDQTVVIKDVRRAGVATGGLPMLQVKMTQAGPQIQTLSTVQGGPPQIPAAPPALSVPRGHGFAATPHAAATRQIALPTVPELPIDQLMLCRHLVEKYLAEQHKTDTAETATTAEAITAEIATTEAVATVRTENVKLAELTISTLDEALVATAVRAEAATKAAAEAAEAEAETLLVEAVIAPSAPGTLAYAAATIAPAPSASYVAGRVGARPQGFVGARATRNSGLAPRRVARPGEPLPPVIVKMDGGRAVVVNQAEIEQVRAAVLNQASVPETLSESPEGAA